MSRLKLARNAPTSFNKYACYLIKQQEEDVVTQLDFLPDELMRNVMDYVDVSMAPIIDKLIQVLNSFTEKEYNDYIIEDFCGRKNYCEISARRTIKRDVFDNILFMLKAMPLLYTQNFSKTNNTQLSPFGKHFIEDCSRIGLRNTRYEIVAMFRREISEPNSRRAYGYCHRSAVFLAGLIYGFQLTGKEDGTGPTFYASRVKITSKLTEQYKHLLQLETSKYAYIQFKTTRDFNFNENILSNICLSLNSKYSGEVYFTTHKVSIQCIYRPDIYKVRHEIRFNFKNPNWKKKISFWDYYRECKLTADISSKDGAPVFTLEELEVIANCFGEVGLKMYGRRPSKIELESFVIV